MHLLGPVALSYRRLYAAAAGSRAGPKRAPGPPRSICHRRLSLFGYAHPKPAVLCAEERDRKGELELLFITTLDAKAQAYLFLNHSQNVAKILQSNKI